MNPFQYVTAHTPDEAISLIGKNGRYLGGGIDLLGEMKEYIVSPDVVVDVKGISKPSVRPDREDGDNGPIVGYSLSGNFTIREIATHQDVLKNFPGLAEAAAEVGSPQIRNVATVSGNLLQHSRCWYYRQPDIICLKRGGSTCYAQDGENKYSSLFSGCACISPVVSNLSVILTALEAEVQTARTSGKTESLKMLELYQPAWKDAQAHNALDPRDIVFNVSIPLLRQRSAYRQVSEKSEFDWALVSCAAAGTVKNGKIFYPRVVLGAVAPVPYMVPEANRFLEGKPLTDDIASQAADIILKDAKPLAQNGYKVPLAHALIRRTLLALNP